MVYQIGGGEDRWEDEAVSFRLFWQTSHGGRFIDAFNEGYDAGKQDLANNSFDYLDFIDSFDITRRDTTWEARRDGYREATKSRGPTAHG